MGTLEARLKALMLAGLAGDAAAQRQLLAQSAVRLRRYFGRRLGSDAPDVEDLVQETLIAIHRRRESYDPRLPFTGWLHGIAKYKLVDYFRRNRARAEVLVDDWNEFLAEDDLEPALARRDLERLLGDLPEGHSAAIRLTRIEGLSVAEAAARSGQSESTIKVGVHRGLKRLVARLRGYER